MSKVRVICRGLEVEEHEASDLSDSKLQISKLNEQSVSEPIYNRRLLLDKAERQLYGQIERFEHSDTKTGVILGFTLVAMAQVLLTMARISPVEVELFKSHPPLFAAIVILFTISLAATIWAVSFGLLSLEPRAVKYLSVKDELQDPDVSSKELLADCVRGLAAGIDWNDDRLEGKLKQSRYAAYGVGVSIVCYVAIAATVALMLLL